MAINSQLYRGRPACVHCGFCQGFACEVTAKASTLTTMIPEAEATGRCEVRPESYVVQIATDKRGLAAGVRYFDRDKREHLQKARAVIVCANGAETPRLLLMSANGASPHGLANSSGLVGKYLMFNSSARTDAVFERELNEYKSVQVSRILHDFYDSDPKRGFYGGGGIDARIGPQPMVWAQRAAEKGANWGSAYKQRLAEFPRSMITSSQGTSLPVATNSVSLDPELKDDWGMPAMRVTYKDHPDDLATARFLQDRSAEILEAAGALRVTKSPVNPQTYSAHLLGTCRMGNDPAESVDRSISPKSRCAESVSVRRQQFRHFGPRPAHDDHTSARLPRCRAHRGLRAPGRNSLRGEFGSQAQLAPEAKERQHTISIRWIRHLRQVGD